MQPIQHQHITRIDPASPDRCQAQLTDSNQCPLAKQEGSNFCVRHSGPHVAQNNAIKAKRIYDVAQWKAKIGEFADANNAKSLKEEIGVLRLLLETQLENCKDRGDLMLRSSSISELVLKIEKLVTSCQKLDKSFGVLLDKTEALQLGQNIIQIVSKYISNEDILQAFAAELIETIEGAGTANEMIQRANLDE